MTVPTRPFLVLYAVWHPHYSGGQEIAAALYSHYRSNLYENIAGGAGLGVYYRSQPDPTSGSPLDIDLEGSETTAIIILKDKNFSEDPVWVKYAHDISDKVEEYGLGARVFPVTIDDVAFDTEKFSEQAIRWDLWNIVSMDFQDSLGRLIRQLSYCFCRMLRHYLAHLTYPEDADAELLKYLQKVKIFLSHSKHDNDGERIAQAIRDKLFRQDGLDTFFDVIDIPAGIRFDRALLAHVRTSAMAAIYTDSYSSREWCRKEIIEAKRANVPLVVANCIHDVDERSFPYLGNVPVVRMDPDSLERIDSVVSRLLDEILKDFLWRCRVMIIEINEMTVFLPRQPELISLVNLPTVEGGAANEITMVYPDPPIGTEEGELFGAIAPHVRLRSLTEWLAEQGL